MKRLIEASLERVAERCADLTPFVYQRLFAEHPDMKALFWRDTTNAVKGEMLAKVFDIILDFIGENSYAANMIQCEVVTHEGYDVPPQTFRLFFGIVAQVVAEQLGDEWTPELDAAWTELLADLDYFVTHPDQNETARTATHVRSNAG
jgi:hemoglobin-like flavoprotein